MTIQDFENNLNLDVPPSYLTVKLKALWWDWKGNWKNAHDLIDHLEDKVSAHIHAYLHRVEGDDWNARYWYGCAKQPVYQGSLEEEWGYLVDKYL